MYCWNCGNSLEGSTGLFCINCGSRKDADPSLGTGIPAETPIAATPASVETTVPAYSPAPEPAPAPAYSPAPAPEPVYSHIPEPVPEPAYSPAPAPEPAPAPAYSPMPEPAPAPAYSSMPEPAPAPAYSAVPEPAPAPDYSTAATPGYPPAPGPAPGYAHSYASCVICGGYLDANGNCPACAQAAAGGVYPGPYAVPAQPRRTSSNPFKSIDTKKLILAGGGVVALAAIVVVAVILFINRPYNPPYEVISIGRYDDIEYIGSGRFIVARGSGHNQRFGIYDLRGNEIIPFGRDVSDFYDFTSEGGFVLRDGRYINVYNVRGNEIASFEGYTYVEFVTSNRFIVHEGGWGITRAGVVDARNNEIIPIGRYTDIRAVQDGRWFIVWDINRVGLVNASGVEVISVGRYDDIWPAGNDRFIVMEGDWLNRRYGAVAVSGTNATEIISFGRYDSIFGAGDSHFIVADGGRYGVYNAAGSVVIPFRYDSITFGGGYFIARDGLRLGVYNSAGNEVIPPTPPGQQFTIFYVGGGHFIIHEGTWGNIRVGVIDSSGAEIVPLGRFDQVQPVQGNRFIVENNGRWAAIDPNGNEIIPLGRFDEIRPLHFGFGGLEPPFEITYDYGFIVRNGDRIGVLNLDGEEIIPMGRYDYVYSIHNGIAIIELRDRIGVINTRRIGE